MDEEESVVFEAAVFSEPVGVDERFVGKPEIVSDGGGFVAFGAAAAVQYDFLGGCGIGGLREAVRGGEVVGRHLHRFGELDVGYVDGVGDVAIGVIVLAADVDEHCVAIRISYYALHLVDSYCLRCKLLRHWMLLSDIMLFYENKNCVEWR
ncbi:hypothetical protein AYI69_g6287 [Smittium culicis]|uniref:Uncharacterized protein n=1 Tax=Smittium culicis TaxID=133412 RepID=A0A1R1Y029_9FUNG|nr:hypothetical protein AYI69_g6287 [Smittium culicis]